MLRHARRCSVVGAVDVVIRARAIDEALIGADARGERVREPARLRALEAGRHRPAQLPGVHLGLARLRVDGHHRAGDVARPGVTLGVGRAEHVDHRVGELSLPPVLLDLAEQRHLRADGQLTLAPTLVEEHDLEDPGAVVHRAAHDRALAVARSARPHRTHLGIDGRLVADRELRDLRTLGAVHVAAGVVLQQVEHRRDAHVGEPRLELGADRAQVAHRPVGQLPQRDASSPFGHGAGLQTDYSAPTRYG